MSGPAAVLYISYSFWLPQSSMCHGPGLRGLCHLGPEEPQHRLCLLTAPLPGMANSKMIAPSLLAGTDRELSWVFFVLHFDTSLDRDTALHSILNVDTALSGLFYDTSLVDSVA